MRNIFILLFLFINVIFLCAQNNLKFEKDGKFKIVQFTDIHWTPGHESTPMIKRGMERILDTEKPDLVVITGDYIHGTPVMKGIDEVFEPIVLRKIPFATIFGNHDSEYGKTKEEILEHLKTIPGNLTTTVEGVPGMSNYVLPVIESGSDKEGAFLYFFDSHSYSDIENFNSYGWIKPEQVEWYLKSSKFYNPLRLPSLAFLHIPLPEYKYAAANEKSPLIGVRREPVCAPEMNTGLFAAMIQCGDVMGVFAGHDHVNDFITMWNGIALAYGRFTGGSSTYCDIPEGAGARVIELKEGERGFSTWVRLADLQTFNKVIYPKDLTR